MPGSAFGRDQVSSKRKGVYHAAVTRILHVSCLTLQSINWVCCSPEAGLQYRSKVIYQEELDGGGRNSCRALRDSRSARIIEA